MNNNMTWDLSIFYKDFKDPKYLNDLNELNKVINEFKALVFDNNNPAKTIEDYLSKEEKVQKLFMEIGEYAQLRLSTNVNDIEAMGEFGKLQMISQELVIPSVAFTKFLANVDLEKLAKENKVINEYLFILNEKKQDSKHMLSDKEEVLAKKLKLVGSDSWSDIQSKLTSNMKIKVKGFENEMPLSAVRNLAYEKDEEVRKNAYYAELESYKSVDTSIAMALNNIKREVNIMMPLRGYKDALEATLDASRLSKATLDAMIGAIEDEYPKLREYFKLKAKALGRKNGLPFYDLFAPMGHLTKTYTYEEAKDLVLEVYKSFSEPLYELGKEAFENRWIDVLPHEGKVGGAFCAGASNHNQSRVLTNFTGCLGDVQTLAHELGHAYHGRVILNNSPLNRDYPMPLAETASILAQTLMANKMINDLSDPFEKLTVVEQSLQESTQCVIDCISRFYFESAVLNTPIAQPLSSEDMCKMMLEAQDKAYGDGLDKDIKHPYMWLCKSHYYSAGLNFYNWPYAFGQLYSFGLYKQYIKNKEEFVKNYDTMLCRTGFMTVEDVAKSMNIDVTKKEFWKESLSLIEDDIETFKNLLKETKMI